jgi:hypothetical protein
MKIFKRFKQDYIDGLECCLWSMPIKIVIFWAIATVMSLCACIFVWVQLGTYTSCRIERAVLSDIMEGKKQIYTQGGKASRGEASSGYNYRVVIPDDSHD